MRRKIIPYSPHLNKLAIKLRNGATFSKVLLWRKLKGKQTKGYDFHRQKPLASFIVDFFCNELMLAIQIDRYSHTLPGAQEKDETRQLKIEKMGIPFLRFQDSLVKKDISSVLDQIHEWIEGFENNHWPQQV